MVKGMSYLLLLSLYMIAQGCDVVDAGELVPAQECTVSQACTCFPLTVVQFCLAIKGIGFSSMKKDHNGGVPVLLEDGSYRWVFSTTGADLIGIKSELFDQEETVEGDTVQQE